MSVQRRAPPTRLLLTRWLLALSAWRGGHALIGLGVCVCAGVLVCTHDAGAEALVEDVPVVGGTAALSRALGIDPAPERARFIAELVHVIYDAPEGRNAARDALRAQVAAHLDAADRLRAALGAAQPAGAGLALSRARDRKDRATLERVLDAIGLHLTQKNAVFSVVPTADRDAAERRRLVSALGIDLDPLITRLNSGASLHIEVPTERIPLPLPAGVWSTAIFQRPVSAENLFSAVIQDRSAALLCHGLAAVDDETLRYLAAQPAVLRRLYEEDAAVFAAFGGSLHIRHKAVLVPGGTSAIPLWESALGERATSPDRFIRELYSRREGRVAYLYDSIAQLEASRRAFALGLWIADPEVRLNRFTSFLNAVEEFPGWGVRERPFSRPPDDAVLMLTRINADDRGAPIAPSWRVFWARALDSLDIPHDGGLRLANLEKDGVIDAAWTTEAILSAPAQLRAERLDQLAFGQRAFAGIPDQDLPDALVAVRAFPRYRMLVLTLERMGIRTTGVYTEAVRHAEQLAMLDPPRAFVALSQFQGALALLARLARVHRLGVTAEEALIRSLSKVPVTGNGYAGGIARWLRSELMPVLDAGTAGADAAILQSLAGRGRAEHTPPLVVSWEERDYRVDATEPEARRIARILQKFKTEPLRLALDLEVIAGPLVRTVPKMNDVAAASAALSQWLASVDPATANKAGHATRDLSRITRPSDADKARAVGSSLLGLADEMLASALRAWAYAVDLGDAGGARVIAGDVSSRHDFGLVGQDNDRRYRQAWAEPEQVVQTSVPWHVAGSLLGLDLGLSQTMLRRLSSEALPRAPRLLAADRNLFAGTVSLLLPGELTDDDIRSVGDAIGAGRERVARLAAGGGTLDEVADDIGMDGWRRRALRWSLTNEPASAASYFSLAELLRLGHPHPSAPPRTWGVAAAPLDGCLCMAFPAPGRWTVMVGRSRGGQVSGQVADLNLRVLLALRELRLPAAVARGVLAAATQDYVDSVMPLYPDDWLTLVRSAQAVSTERIADYVAALTADGTLSPATLPQGAR
ncbi:MAG TPA: hypothetical protein VM032_19280 [Vicinamibacterales bacterium]|nr:hypothetical protein [Vicinamibacterales bacterium]